MHSPSPPIPASPQYLWTRAAISCANSLSWMPFHQDWPTYRPVVSTLEGILYSYCSHYTNPLLLVGPFSISIPDVACTIPAYIIISYTCLCTDGLLHSLQPSKHVIAETSMMLLSLDEKFRERSGVLWLFLDLTEWIDLLSNTVWRDSDMDMVGEVDALFKSS